MSDFFQILQREQETKKEKEALKQKSDVILEKNKDIEKGSEKTEADLSTDITRSETLDNEKIEEKETPELDEFTQDEPLENDESFPARPTEDKEMTKEDYLELSRQFIEKVEILKKKRQKEREEVLKRGIKNQIWLTLAEAAKFSGVDIKTIRRAVKASPGTEIRYKIQNNKYIIDLRSLIQYMHSSTKLKNKLYQNGLGQYVKGFKN